MEKQIINSTNAPAPIGPYNQAVQAGNMLFISGQIALNPESGQGAGRYHRRNAPRDAEPPQHPF